MNQDPSLLPPLGWDYTISIPSSQAFARGLDITLLVFLGLQL